MKDGFLGYQTSFMLDFVVCSLVMLVPLLLVSLFLVKNRRKYAAHRTLQFILAAVLLLAVTAFEVDLQWIQGGWMNIIAKQDPPLTAEEILTVRKTLYVHLVFAISTPIVWIVTLGMAWRRFPTPPQPGAHSSTHKTWGWIAVVDLVLTSVTGLIFYYVAFVG